MLINALDQILRYLPRYFEAIGLILARPVEEVATRAANPSCFPDALLLWLISQILSLAMTYIAYMQLADQALYLVSSVLASGLALAVFAFGLRAAFALAGGRSGGSAAAVVAYIWAALGPVQAVLMVLGMGSIRLADPRAHELLTGIMRGCAGEGGLDAVAGALAALGEQGQLKVIAIVLTQVAILSISVTLMLIYLIAVLRVMRRLGNVSGARYAIACVLAVPALAAGLSVAFAFDLALLQGTRAC